MIERFRFWHGKNADVSKEWLLTRLVKDLDFEEFLGTVHTVTITVTANDAAEYWIQGYMPERLDLTWREEGDGSTAPGRDPGPWRVKGYPTQESSTGGWDAVDLADPPGGRTG